MLHLNHKIHEYNRTKKASAYHPEIQFLAELKGDIQSVSKNKLPYFWVIYYLV